MDDKYKGLTQEEFSDILGDIIHEMSSDEILAIPNVYAIMAEELNNEVLNRYKSKEK